jgi:hypothetical protein
MDRIADNDEFYFDEVVAMDLIGKYVLVGVTVEDRHGAFRRQEEFHGTVVSADGDAGITLALRGRREREFRKLPPATNVFRPAAPGIYRLRSSGEEVLDPDFTATWLVVEADG